MGIRGRILWGEVAVRKRTISIATVAAEAGVGVGTVSRVLNGSSQVSEATRNRVLSTMERLDYRPLRSASSLSKGRTDAVGILVSVISRPSVMARLVGVIDVLSDAGLDAVVFNVIFPPSLISAASTALFRSHFAFPMSALRASGNSVFHSCSSTTVCLIFPASTSTTLRAALWRRSTSYRLVTGALDLLVTTSTLL